MSRSSSTLAVQSSAGFQTPRVILMRALRLATLAAVTLSIVSPSAAHAQQTSAAPATSRAFPSDSALLAIIKQRVAEKRSAGIVVGVLHPDGHTQLVATGDSGPGRPP